MSKEGMIEKCRERLIKVLGRKFDTTMIFPLSQFETAFGELWGHNLPKEKLTDSQLIMRAKWDQCRANILNTGNQQKRNMAAEIGLHDVYWNRYQSQLVPMHKD